MELSPARSAQRTREIGVRWAPGAERTGVYRLIFKEAGVMIAIGVVPGIACSIGVTGFMQSILFGVSSRDFPTSCGVAIVLTICALLASFIPARRAASVKPGRRPAR